MHNNLANVNFASHILYGLARSGPLPASSSLFSLSGPSTSFLHLQPWWSGYCLFFEERFSMFNNLPSQYLGVLVWLIEESWYRRTEAERGVSAINSTCRVCEVCKIIYDSQTVLVVTFGRRIHREHRQREVRERAERVSWEE